MAINTSGFQVGVMPQYTPTDPSIAANGLANIIPQITDSYGRIGTLADLQAARDENRATSAGRVAAMNAQNQLSVQQSGALGSIIPELTEAQKTGAQANTATAKKTVKLTPHETELKLMEYGQDKRLFDLRSRIQELQGRNTEASLQLANDLAPKVREIETSQANLGAMKAEFQKDWYSRYGRDASDTELSAALVNNQKALKEATRLVTLYDEISPALDALDKATIAAGQKKQEALFANPILNFPQVARAGAKDPLVYQLMAKQASKIGVPVEQYEQLTDLGFGPDLARMVSAQTVLGVPQRPTPGSEFENAWNEIVLGNLQNASNAPIPSVNVSGGKMTYGGLNPAPAKTKTGIKISGSKVKE